MEKIKLYVVTSFQKKLVEQLYEALGIDMIKEFDIRVAASGQEIPKHQMINSELSKMGIMSIEGVYHAFDVKYFKGSQDDILMSHSPTWKIVIRHRKHCFDELAIQTGKSKEDVIDEAISIFIDNEKYHRCYWERELILLKHRLKDYSHKTLACYPQLRHHNQERYLRCLATGFLLECHPEGTKLVYQDNSPTKYYGPVCETMEEAILRGRACFDELVEHKLIENLAIFR